MSISEAQLTALRASAEMDVAAQVVTKIRPLALLALLDGMEALRADAERHRWTRSKVRGKRDRRGRCEFDMPDPHPLGNIMQGSVAQHFDAAIDAAIASQQAKGEEGKT